MIMSTTGPRVKKNLETPEISAPGVHHSYVMIVDI